VFVLLMTFLEQSFTG